jgi:thioredoxin-related protein
MKLLIGLGVLLSSWFVINHNGETQKCTTTKMLNVNKTPYVSYVRAVELAQKSEKMIMIKLTAEYCGYCKKMDKEVMDDKEVLSILEKNFITVEIDVDKEKIPLGIERTLTPTFIFVDKNEKVLSKIPGSWNKKDFLELLTSRVK